MPSRKCLRLLAWLLFTTSVFACRGNPTTVLSRLDESINVATNLRVHFDQVADASNRAVMADTDEISAASARDSKVAMNAVDKDVATLAKLLEGLSYADEARILREFSFRFSEYRELDGHILALAVEDTNLKAQALSFGPANQAAGEFTTALRSAQSLFPQNGREPLDVLIAETLLAVREIQVMLAPHIAERENVAMTRIEKDMAALDAKARDGLKSLTALAPSDSRAALTNALAALDRFAVVSKQIVELSRRNTNLLALDLSLRKKPALVAACNERLTALQEALATEGPKSTR